MQSQYVAIMWLQLPHQKRVLGPFRLLGLPRQCYPVLGACTVHSSWKILLSQSSSSTWSTLHSSDVELCTSPNAGQIRVLSHGMFGLSRDDWIPWALISNLSEVETLTDEMFPSLSILCVCAKKAIQNLQRQSLQKYKPMVGANADQAWVFQGFTQMISPEHSEWQSPHQDK